MKYFTLTCVVIFYYSPDDMMFSSCWVGHMIFRIDQNLVFMQNNELYPR